MTLIQLIITLILGVVEGITEWLPISSTGHMILVEDILKRNNWVLTTNVDFWNVFLVVIQLGAIFAVLVIFWNKIFPFKMKNNKIKVDNDIFVIWFKIIVASLPAMIIGLPFDKKIEELFNNTPTVTTTLIIYGVLFILVEIWNKGKKPKVNSLAELSYKTALIIGLFQVLAVIPGTSRSGATIVGALAIGVSRTVAAEFTFYLAIPVMFGASLLKVVKYILEFGLFTTNEVLIVLVGMISAFLVSIWAIKFLVGYIKKHDFKVFGYYRIGLGIILILYMVFF